MIHLDTSGAMTLVRPGAHSDDLSHLFSERLGLPVLSSVLIEVEPTRATRRSSPDRVTPAADVLRGIDILTVSPSVIARATAHTDPGLRSLDAIHLATAEHVVSVTRKDLEAFVAYDERLLAAARHAGLPVAAPGVT